MYPSTFWGGVSSILISAMIASSLSFLPLISLGYAPDKIPYIDVIFMPFLLICSIIFVLIMNKIKKKKFIYCSFKLNNPSFIFLSILLIISLSFSIICPLSNFLTPITVSSITLKSIIGPVVIGPFIEEIFFRGILLKGFMTRYSIKKSIVLSSLIFACAHFDGTSELYICLSHVSTVFIYSIIYSLIFVKTASLLNTIVLHSVTNLVVLSIGYINFKFGQPTLGFDKVYGDYTLLIVSVSALVSITSLYFWIKKIKTISIKTINKPVEVPELQS